MTREMEKTIKIRSKDKLMELVKEGLLSTGPTPPSFSNKTVKFKKGNLDNMKGNIFLGELMDCIHPRVIRFKRCEHRTCICHRLCSGIAILANKFAGLQAIVFILWYSLIIIMGPISQLGKKPVIKNSLIIGNVILFYPQPPFLQ